MIYFLDALSIVHFSFYANESKSAHGHILHKIHADSHEITLPNYTIIQPINGKSSINQIRLVFICQKEKHSLPFIKHMCIKVI